MIEQEIDHITILIDVVGENNYTGMAFDSILIFFGQFDHALIDIGLKFNRCHRTDPLRSVVVTPQLNRHIGDVGVVLA